MKKVSTLLALAGVALGMLAATPAAYAHATYNVGGYGDITSTNGTPSGSPGGTTGGGVSGSSFASGSSADPVWLNGAGSPIPGSTTVPYLGYLGLHNAATTRVITTGTYASGQANSLLGQAYTYNHLAANATNQIPTDLALAVAPNSFSSFSSSTSFAGGVNSTGVDVGAIHVSTGTGNVEQNVINLAGGNPLYLNVILNGDNGLGDQQLAFSLYHGWAQAGANDLSGLTLITTQTFASAGAGAYYAYQLNGAADPAGQYGQYTVVVGALSGVGGKYSLSLSTSTTAVPIPAAVWLFGSSLLGVFGVGRRKQAAA